MLVSTRGPVLLLAVPTLEVNLGPLATTGYLLRLLSKI